MLTLLVVSAEGRAVAERNVGKCLLLVKGVCEKIDYRITRRGKTTAV